MPDYNVSTYPQTPPAAGENLYGWTDSNLETQLYGWTEPGESLYAWAYRGSDVYTHSPMPLAGDYIYNADGTVVSNNPQVEEDSDGSTMYDGYNSWSRDSANDIIGTNTRYYTTSTTPTVGMTLYDENGTDTGLAVASINQDGSWDLASSYTFSFDKDNTVTNYVIDGVTYTDDTSVDLADGTHTIVVNGSRTHVYIQGYATCDGPGATISFIVSGSVITLILPNAGSNETFDAAILTYPIQLTIVNEPI